MKIFKVGVLCLTVGLPAFAVFFARPKTSATAADRPSVILVVLDACRADHLSLLGYSRQTTPRIDALASQAMVFAQHYSGSNGTITGVSQLLTSRLSPKLLLSAPGGGPLPDENAAQSLPMIFEDAGYRTALFAGNPYFHPRLAPVSRIFDTFVNVAALKPPQEKANLSDLLDQFEPWLAGQKAPFFAYLHAMDTHFPHPLRARAPVFADRNFRPSFAAGAAPPESTQLKNAAERRYVVDLYDEDLHEADRAIGRLVDTLAQRGQLDNTIIVITADHGEQLYESGYAGHGGGIGNLPDSETHIPLIIRFGHQLRAEHVGAITRSIDVAPTILDLAGLRPPVSMMGNSLVAGQRGSFAFNPAGASEFAPIFNQDREPVRVALRFAGMKYFTRWASGDSAPEVNPSAGEVLVSIPGGSVIPGDDVRFREARMAWSHLLPHLQSVRVQTDATTRRLRERLETLGYVAR